MVEFILYKAYADLRAEAARSYLGLLWWFVEPVLYLCAFYTLFVLVLHRGGSNFVPTFLCGTVVWKWFDSGVKGGSRAISANQGMLQQVYVPKYVFPLIAVVGSTVRFLPVFMVFSLFLLLYGIPFHTTWLAAPALMITEFCLISVLAMFLGAVTPFLPDIRVVIDNGMLLLFFLSGIFYNINKVHEPLKSYLLLNPMAGLIDEYRNILIRGIWPDPLRLGIILCVSVVLVMLSLALFKRLDHKYGKVRF